MQTFLAFPDFAQSAKCLDYRRVGKQRIEAKQILLTLKQGPKSLYCLATKKYIYGPIPKDVPNDHVIRDTPWFNHPAVKMWAGCEHNLCMYGIAICNEWRARGYVDNQLSWFTAKLSGFEPKTPDWLGFEAFHLAHRSNLIRKYPEYYQNQWPDVPNDLEYVWPSRGLGVSRV